MSDGAPEVEDAIRRVWLDEDAVCVGCDGPLADGEQAIELYRAERSTVTDVKVTLDAKSSRALMCLLCALGSDVEDLQRAARS